MVADVPITPTSPVRVDRDRPPHRRPDHLDHRHVVPLPGVGQAGRGGGVAGDDQHLHAAVDQLVTDRQGVPADLGDGQRAVRTVRGVADVADLLARAAGR